VSEQASETPQAAETGTEPVISVDRTASEQAPPRHTTAGHTPARHETGHSGTGHSGTGYAKTGHAEDSHGAALSGAAADVGGGRGAVGHGAHGGAGGSGASAGADPAERRGQPLLVESIGGWRGLLDSGLPVVVFVAANAVGGLTAAIWAAICCGVLLLALRLLRRESVQQAISGFLGIALAAYIASRTGEAKGFFLLGIWASFLYAALFLASVLVRWPLVGVVWEYVDGGGGTWRREAALFRVYIWTTLLWVGVFLSRGVVQRFLYEEDRTGWLAVARLAMGYPVTVGALAVTILAVRRVRRRITPVPAGA
jgi:hypothetical protein